MATLDRVLIDNGQIRSGQNLTLVRVHKVWQNDGPIDHRFTGKVRVTAARDTSYAFQSHYFAEVWHEKSMAWHKVVSLDGQDPTVKDADLEVVAKRLLEDAKVVLT